MHVLEEGDRNNREGEESGGSKRWREKERSREKDRERDGCAEITRIRQESGWSSVQNRKLDDQVVFAASFW